MKAREAGAFARVTEELAQVLMPALRSALPAATREIEALREGGSALAGPGAAEVHARFEHLHAENARWGWILGVLGAGHGVDVLGLRCERAGLGWMLAALCAARPELDLEPGAAALPPLECSPPASWQVPLLAAWMVHQAHDPAAPRVAWRSGVAGAWNTFESELSVRSSASEREISARCADLTRAAGAHLRLECRPRALVLGYCSRY